MRTYEVHARTWAHGWELHIEGVGVTQCHSRQDVAWMARDLISRRTGLDPAEIDLTVVLNAHRTPHEEEEGPVVKLDDGQLPLVPTDADRLRALVRRLKLAGIEHDAQADLLRIAIRLDRIEAKDR